jgi:hypothetical protein
MVNVIRRIAHRPVVALVIATSFFSSVALAGDAATAEALFREGRERLAAGDVQGACVKFQESQRIDASPGTLLNLATCHERDGKLATAWAEFVAAAKLAKSRGDPTQSGEAERRAAALVPRVPHLTIVMAAPPIGVIIRRDDVELGDGSFGSPLPVDPGPHRIVVSAPGHAAATLDVSLREAEAREVTVPDLMPEKAPPAKAKTVTPPDHAPAPVSSNPDARLGWVIGGAGVALAATGGALYAMALSADHTAQRACGYDGHYACTPTAKAAESKRDTLATFATISGAVGIAGIGVGLWFLLQPATPSGPGTSATVSYPRFVPEVFPHGTGVSFHETFE